MISKLSLRTACLAALISAQPALADIVCTSSISYIYFEAGGIDVQTGFGRYGLCSLNSAMTVNVAHYGSQTITTQLCQGLLSSMITARATNKNVSFYFGASSCPAGTNPEYPYAIQLNP